MATRRQALFLAFLLTPQISDGIINASFALKCMGHQGRPSHLRVTTQPRGGRTAGNRDVPGSWWQGEEGRVRGEDGYDKREKGAGRNWTPDHEEEGGTCYVIVCRVTVLETEAHSKALTGKLISWCSV